VLAWQQTLTGNWNSVSFGPLRVEDKQGGIYFEVSVHLGGIEPGAVRVELFAEGKNGEEPVRKAMDRGALISPNTFQYSASVEGHRSAGDFTPRVVPWHSNASVPLEARQILWQK
jgi:starch phosphorylase